MNTKILERNCKKWRKGDIINPPLAFPSTNNSSLSLIYKDHRGFSVILVEENKIKAKGCGGRKRIKCHRRIYTPGTMVVVCGEI